MLRQQPARALLSELDWIAGLVAYYSAYFGIDVWRSLWSGSRSIGTLDDDDYYVSTYLCTTISAIAWLVTASLLKHGGHHLGMSKDGWSPLDVRRPSHVDMTLILEQIVGNLGWMDVRPPPFPSPSPGMAESRRDNESTDSYYVYVKRRTSNNVRLTPKLSRRPRVVVYLCRMHRIQTPTIRIAVPCRVSCSTCSTYRAHCYIPHTYRCNSATRTNEPWARRFAQMFAIIHHQFASIRLTLTRTLESPSRHASGMLPSDPLPSIHPASGVYELVTLLVRG